MVYEAPHYAKFNTEGVTLMTIRLLGVCGSVRADSYSSRLADIVLAAAREHGAETRLIELNALDLPIYNPEMNRWTMQVCA